MRNIYTSIDMGCDSVKIVVAELFEDNFYVLASTSKRCHGIKKGLVVDKEKAMESLNSAIDDIEKQIGIRINKAIITVSSRDRKLKIVSGSYVVKGENSPIGGKDINKALENAVVGSYEEEDELVCVMPIVFSVDDKKNVFDPKGMVGKKLGVKAVIGVVPKKNLYPFMMVFEDCGIDIVDIAFGSIGDYYLGATKDNDKAFGAVINIGEDTTNVSIFNKKILIKNDIIPLGSKNVDNDIMYIYKVNRGTAKYLKEKYAVASSKYSDVNDNMEIELSENEKININQDEITRVIEARIVELLKLSKNAINNLTNRKISYIIVTGGIANMTGFGNVVENTLGISAVTIPINIVGIRNSKFSSAAGIIKYYDQKMKLRDKTYSMFNKEQIEKMMAYESGSSSVTK